MCARAGAQWNGFVKAGLSGGQVRAAVLLWSLTGQDPCHMVAKQVKNLVCGNVLKGLHYVTLADLGGGSCWKTVALCHSGQSWSV